MGAWTRACTIVSTCLVMALFAGGALADDAQSQAAEALYRQAISLMKVGRLDEACEKFDASHSIEPGVGTLLYLGDCYEKLDRFASALATFEEAARLAGQRGDSMRQHLASVRAAALEPRAPALEIRSRPVHGSMDLQVTVNGAPITGLQMNRAVRRDAGSYEVVVRAVGYQSFTTRIELQNGEPDPVVVTIPRLSPVASKVAASDASTPMDRPAVGATQRTLAWVAGSVGVALGVATGVVALLASSKLDDSKAACNPVDANSCGPEGVALRRDARSLANVATVTGVLGGIGVAGGVVLHLTAPTAPNADQAGRGLMLGFEGSF